MKSLLITGASGFLGSNFCRIYADEFELHGLYCSHKPSFSNVSLYQADLTFKKQVQQLINTIKPEGVIHLAALSDPNVCELNPKLSDKVNIKSAEHLATICQANNIPLVYTSTDLVFDGEVGNYSEKDIPSPINVYGMHKAIAEESVRDIYPKAIVCRLPLMYGHSYAQGKSFLTSMLEKLRNEEKIRLFTDEYRTPASAADVCAGLLLCLETEGGIYHLSGDERLSRYKMGRQICSVFGFSEELLEQSRQRDVSMPAARPGDVSMSNEKAKALGWQPHKFTIELERIKREIYSPETI